jgi:hypothetical protein
MVRGRIVRKMYAREKCHALHVRIWGRYGGFDDLVKASALSRQGYEFRDHHLDVQPLPVQLNFEQNGAAGIIQIWYRRKMLRYRFRQAAIKVLAKASEQCTRIQVSRRI